MSLRRFCRNAGVCLAVLAGTLTVTSGSAGAQDGGYFALLAETTFPEPCLLVEGIDKPLKQTSPSWCTWEKEHNFAPVPRESGAYQLRTKRGNCLDLEASGRHSLDLGVGIVERRCDDARWEQEWWMNGLGWDFYEIANRRSSLCMDVWNNSPNNGVRVIQYTCDGERNQIFHLF